MGVSYNVYLGPYIQVHNPKQDHKKSVRCCPEPACDNNGIPITAKFCSICGSKIIDCKVPVRERLEFYAYEETKDRLYELSSEYPPDGKEDYIFFTSNVGKIGRHFSAYDTHLEALNETVLTSEVQQFKQKFDKDIERLNEVFGKDAVQILWGVIAYAS